MNKGDIFKINKVYSLHHGHFPGGVIQSSDGKTLNIMRGLDLRSDTPERISSNNLWRKSSVDLYGFKLLEYKLIDKGRKKL